MKTIILGNWKSKDTKEYLSNPKEIWFLKDLKTNKYYSLFGMEPDNFDKEMVKRTEYIYMGKKFLGKPLFDENFKIRKGDFTVVTGHPSSGKSTFVNHLMCQLVKHHGLKIGFASFEQKPQTDHLRLLRKWYLFDYELFDKGYFQADEMKQLRCNKWIDNNFCVIVPSFEDMVDLPWLIEKMQVAVLQKNCDVIVIDPFNELDHDTTGDPMRLYIGLFIKTLKRFAQRHDVHVLVVAHPRKLSKDKEGNIEIPNLYDIEESSMWYNKTDLGLIIHRQDGFTLARVAKSRYEDMIGKRGQRVFMYNEDSAHFDEHKENDY